jgi:hypothetical protein
MLKKFDMENAKPIKTPMPTNGHLDLNEDGKAVDQKLYHSMIGSLLYLCACLVSAFVHGFKPILRNVILWLLREF